MHMPVKSFGHDTNPYHMVIYMSQRKISVPAAKSRCLLMNINYHKCIARHKMPYY